MRKQQTFIDFENKKNLYFSAFKFLWAVENSSSVDLSMKKVLQPRDLIVGVK